MRSILLLIPIIILVISCDEDLVLNTDKYTYYDDFNDITYINDHFYTTNYDLSGNSGQQIDLFRLDDNGENIEDTFPLNLNGQGYLAATSNGSDIFLQSRNTNLIFRYSAVGEFAYMVDDTVGNQWQVSGISYIDDLDSLFVFYRDTDNPDTYRARMLSLWMNPAASRDITVTWDFIDTGYHGAYAAAYKDGMLFFLGVDQSGEDILFQTDLQLDPITQENISDSTVVGLCFRGDDLYLSYRERRIEFWNSYPNSLF